MLRAACRGCQRPLSLVGSGRDRDERQAKDVVWLVDALSPIATRVATAESTEVEPGRSLIDRRSLEATAAGSACDRRRLTVADRRVVPVRLAGVEHRRGPRILGNEETAAVLRRVSNATGPGGFVTAPAGHRLGCDPVSEWSKLIGTVARRCHPNGQCRREEQPCRPTWTSTTFRA
jgi:hypothetical protein